ncbi:MAG: GIY-YIG nuclease family protein [Nitrospirota bacterium]
MKKTGTRSWILYILKCGDGTLYTGITNDIDRRIELHTSGVASKYTRSRLPVALVHKESCRGRANALKKEYAIKQLSRAEKEDYIKKPWKIL